MPKETRRETTRIPSALISYGRVRDTHPRYWTIDVELENGAYYESLPVLMPYFHQENGEGIFALPEVGAHCAVLTHTAEGHRPTVLGFVPLRTSIEGEVDKVESDHSASRGSATPGDVFLHGRDGNFVRLRRGGLVELGASEGARSQYYPVGDLIRHICANYETFVSGSYIKAHTLDSPEIPDEGPTPLQVDVMVQEYAEKAPIINFTFGHVVGDETRNLSDADDQRVVGRLLVYGQETVDLAEAAGVDPSPDQAKCAIRFDREGNYEHILSGQYLLKAGGRRLYLMGSDSQVIRGNRTVRVTGNLDSQTGGDVIDRADGSRYIHSRGPLTLSCEQLVVEERRSGANVLAGDRNQEIGGNSVERTAGDRRHAAGGSSTDTVAGDRVETTGGKHIHTVLHAASPTSALQDAVASLLNVIDGRVRTAALNGSIEFIVGPASAPLCKVKIHNSPRPDKVLERGRISIEWFNPEQQLIIDGATGAIHYENTVGEWVLDATGRTYMGTKNAPAGNVVTTLTQPVCFVTGAPIMGCPAVSAGGPGVLPYAAAPVVRPTDNSADPDIPVP